MASNADEFRNFEHISTGAPLSAKR
jgi:hypothetical protein